MALAEIAQFLSANTQPNLCFLRAISDVGYAVLRRTVGETEIAIEVAAGRQLNNEVAAENQQWLYDQGFRRKRASANFSKCVPIDTWTADELSAWLDLIFKHYFQSGDYELSVLQLTAVSLNNEPIIEAMRHLAKNRDWAARKTLYRLLIDGSFLVPVDENNGPLVVDKIGSFPVCAIFTDLDLFVKSNPLGGEFLIKSGREVFPSLASKRFGSMRINPNTEVRGELYLNELQMLVQGIARLDTHYGRH